MTTNETVPRTRTVDGVRVPTFLYGTAWKEERTAELVATALEVGFRGIDTANQRKHYHEAGVGEGVRRTLETGEVDRDDLFLQTKFTHVEGQDHRLPYDRDADYPTRVRQSMESSLEHLGAERIDSYVLHGPRSRMGLTDADRQVWRTMGELQDEGVVGLLGISNVTASQLAALCELEPVRPAFVQNRCFARTGWDRATREVCEQHDVVYQGFSLLTANRAELNTPTMRKIAARHELTVPQLAFRFALQLGMIPLTGTTDREHMRQDLAVYDAELPDDDVEAIETVAG